jgi:hypothetical protein
VRQLALKEATGYVAPISDSSGPKRVGELEPSSQTQSGGVAVCQAVLSFQVQRIATLHIKPRLTVPLRN